MHIGLNLTNHMRGIRIKKHAEAYLNEGHLGARHLHKAKKARTPFPHDHTRTCNSPYFPSASRVIVLLPAQWA
jgi:hypothetical protein